MSWIFKNKIAIIVAVIGAISGLLYWNFIGCATGNCGVTANWHTSLGFGGVMGWLIGDVANDKINKSDKK